VAEDARWASCAAGRDDGAAGRRAVADGLLRAEGFWLALVIAAPPESATTLKQPAALHPDHNLFTRRLRHQYSHRSGESSTVRSKNNKAFLERQLPTCRRFWPGLE